MIFFHNPKCGGSSIRYALDSLCNIKPIKWYNDRDIIGHKYWYHEHAAPVRTYFARWAKYDYKAFGLIRNPWDRMVSWHFYTAYSKEYLPKGIIKVDGKYKVLDLSHADNIHLHAKKPEISFDDFVETCYDVMIKNKDRFKYDIISPDNIQFKPATESDDRFDDRFWTCRLLYPALAQNFFVDNHKNYCVKIFKLERLDEVVEYVYKISGIKIQIPHINKSERDKDYRRYYNKKLERMVEEIYCVDVELGQYRF